MTGRNAFSDTGVGNFTKKKKAGVKEKSVFFLMWFYEKSSLEETFEHQQQQSRFPT